VNGPILCSVLHCTYDLGCAHLCLLAPIETINKPDKTKIKKSKKIKVTVISPTNLLPYTSSD